MDPKTHDLILSAWRENRLAAVHVDLQNMYHVDHVFPSVGQFASRNRDFNIPNIWVTFPNIGMKKNPAKVKLKPCLTTVDEFNAFAEPHSDHNPKSMMAASAGARGDETVVVKDWSSAFRMYTQPLLHHHLQKNNKDTLLVSGVTWSGCVLETLTDGAMLDKYDLVAVEDCIDFPKGIDLDAVLLTKALDYLLRRNKHTVDTPELAADVERYTSAFQRRFYRATSESIFASLATAQSKTCEPVTLAVADLKCDINS